VTLFDAQAFARRIRVRIAERGISQADAALEIGCSKATLSRVCRASVPDVENYFRIEAWLAKDVGFKIVANQWARLQHQEQMAEIDAALSEPDK
jgi:transcriptional regulator with XRE-family HTH domain